MPGERFLEGPLRRLRRLGREGVTAHSFRTLFLDWAERNGTTKGSATAALGYPGEAGAERLRGQRELMERWAASCLASKVALQAPAEPA